MAHMGLILIAFKEVIDLFIASSRVLGLKVIAKMAFDSHGINDDLYSWHILGISLIPLASPFELIVGFHM